MHLLQHLLGIDSPNSPIYLFFSGPGSLIIALGGGLAALARLEHKHRQHMQTLHAHIDQLIAKSTEENS
jgi:hypothetical protein